jgi:tRNA A37 threonylcarbamoyladenosine biosynthesis protein TsaE
MTNDHTNIQFQLAADFINYTNRSIFLTGKAGTGKTTFLKHIKQHSIKQMAIVVLLFTPFFNCPLARLFPKLMHLKTMKVWINTN